MRVSARRPRCARRGRATAASRPRRAAATLVRATLLERSSRLALEVDDPEAVGRDQHLAEVVVAMDPGEQRRAGECLEDGELRRDPRRQVAQARRPASPGDDVDRARQLGPRRAAPATRTRRGSRPWLEIRHPSRVGERGVQAGGQRPKVGGDLGREFDADLARREEPGGQRLGDRLVGVGGVGDERLGDGDRRRSGVDRDHLGEAGERRTAPKPPPRSGTRRVRARG